MAATDLFHTFKWIIGGMRNDAAPTVADGSPAALRLNSNSELLVSVASSANEGDVDLTKVGGTTTLTGGVNGSLGVGGLAAQGANVAGNPVPTAGQYRSDATALALDNNDAGMPQLDLQGHLITRSNWEPIDAGGSRVSIGSSAARSGALTVGAEYHLYAKVDCWIVAGGVAVDAVAGADYFLPAGIIFPYVVKTGKNYISVIRDAVDSSNGLSLCRVV